MGETPATETADPPQALFGARGKMVLPMQQIPVKLSLEELQALLEMVENQLFRMKFIDSKMPGHKANPEKQRFAASAVSTLQEAFKKAKGFKSKDAA